MFIAFADRVGDDLQLYPSTDVLLMYRCRLGGVECYVEYPHRAGCVYYNLCSSYCTTALQ